MTSHFVNFHGNSDPTFTHTIEPTGWYSEPWWTARCHSFYYIMVGS